jgi:hypothetical protein
MGSSQNSRKPLTTRNLLKSEISKCLIKYVGRKSDSYKNFNSDPQGKLNGKI